MCDPGFCQIIVKKDNKTKETYKIADIIIEIDSIYRDVRDYCRSYLCDGIPDLTVTITENDIEYDTFMFHASAVAVDGAAYLFTANSGTGKSTHTRLWREYLGERAVMINDDRPLIRITKAEAFRVLYKQSYHPDDSAALAKTETLLDKLTDRVSLWRPGCNMDISAAEVAYNAMKE